MLPPLGAALSASVDYQTATRQPPQPGLPSASADMKASSPLPANLLSGGRINVLSLSSQAHLAQGLSVFAEAVGSYLKISRREGESLVDYAQRLVEGLKSLTPQQRTALEQAITQLVRGITLKMLTEILKNPIGPEAARLNAYMQSSPFPDRDPAARAVVSSYRQNAAAEMPAGTTNSLRPPTLPALGTSGAQAQAISNSQQPMASGTGVAAAAIQPGLSAGQAPTAGRVQVDAELADVQPSSQEQMSDSSKSPPAAPETARTTAVRARLEQAARLVGLVTGNPSGPAPDDAPGLPSPRSANDHRATVQDVIANRLEPTAQAKGNARGSLVIYDAPALARVAAQRLQEEIRALPKQEVRYLVEKLAAQFEQAVPPGTAARSGARAVPSPALPQPDDATRPSTAGSGSDRLVTKRHDARNPVVDLAARLPTDLPLPGQVSVSETAPRSTGANALIEQALLLPMASMVAREGFVQPLVSYPPAPLAPEEEERDVERLSPVDEDGENRSSGQESREDPDQDAEHESSVDDPPEPGDDGNAADHAQDLYWRMADLT